MPMNSRETEETAVVHSGDDGPIDDLARDAPTLTGRIVAERFDLLELVGSGGFASVYRSFDRMLGRDVALKILHRNRTDDRTVQRFRREATIARDVESLHLVRVFDTGSWQGRPYLVLEYLPGGTLRERLRRAPLTLEEALEIADQLLVALEALHDRGLVHRDVKPSNVLFDGNGRVKLGDFGLVRWTDGELSRSLEAGAVLGTAHYASPEQIRGLPVVPASDLFSLGVLLFEALAGVLPYDSDDVLSSLLSRLTRDSPSLSSVCPSVPVWVDHFVAKLLARDPGVRYTSAREARRELASRRIRRSGRYLRRAAGVALALVMAATAAIAWSWTGSRFARLEVVDGRFDSRPGTGMRAVDRRGRVLWEKLARDGFASRHWMLARTGAGGESSVVTFLGVEGYGDPSDFRIVTFAPQTGDLRHTVSLGQRLTDGQRWEWRGLQAVTLDMPPQFVLAGLHAVDLDADGVDEILADFHHLSEWPWFSILWEPVLDRVRVVAVGAGHMTFGGAHDLDGDGTPELVFSGFNSLLGRYPAVLVHRLATGIGRAPHIVGASIAPISTPGLDEWVRGRSRMLERGLAWARLLPRGDIRYKSAHRDGVAFDSAARLIRIGFEDRAPDSLGFDGGSHSDLLPPEAAAAARFEALHAIDQSRVAARAGNADEAVAAASAAAQASRSVGDPVLLEIANRTLGSVLVAAGESSKAEPLFLDLAESPEARSEIAYTAATAYHLAGDLEPAVRWYREGIAAPGHLRPEGRQRMYFLEGLVLALAEQGRWDLALDAVSAYERVMPVDSARARLMTTWISQRIGRPLVKQTPELPSRAEIDSLRLMALDLMADPARSAPASIELAREAIAASYQGRGAARLILGELLAAEGRISDAREQARLGIAELERFQSESVVARGFLALWRGRADRILGHSSTPAEAND